MFSCQLISTSSRYPQTPGGKGDILVTEEETLLQRRKSHAKLTSAQTSPIIRPLNTSPKKKEEEEEGENPQPKRNPDTH